MDRQLRPKQVCMTLLADGMTLNFFAYRWSGMLLLHGCTFLFGWEVIDARFITSNSPVKCFLFLSLILTKLFQSKSILLTFCSGFRSMGNTVVQTFWNSMWSCIVILPNLYECPVATATSPILTCLSAQIITDTWLNNSICHSFNCANRSVIIFQFWTSLLEFLNPVWTARTWQLQQYTGRTSLWMSFTKCPFTHVKQTNKQTNKHCSGDCAFLQYCTIIIFNHSGLVSHTCGMEPLWIVLTPAVSNSNLFHT